MSAVHIDAERFRRFESVLHGATLGAGAGSGHHHTPAGLNSTADTASSSSDRWGVRRRELPVSGIQAWGFPRDTHQNNHHRAPPDPLWQQQQQQQQHPRPESIQLDSRSAAWGLRSSLFDPLPGTSPAFTDVASPRVSPVRPAHATHQRTAATATTATSAPTPHLPAAPSHLQAPGAAVVQQGVRRHPASPPHTPRSAASSPRASPIRASDAAAVLRGKVGSLITTLDQVRATAEAHITPPRRPPAGGREVTCPRCCFAWVDRLAPATREGSCSGVGSAERVRLSPPAPGRGGSGGGGGVLREGMSPPRSVARDRAAEAIPAAVAAAVPQRQPIHMALAAPGAPRPGGSFDVIPLRESPLCLSPLSARQMDTSVSRVACTPPSCAVPATPLVGAGRQRTPPRAGRQHCLMSPQRGPPTNAVSSAIVAGDNFFPSESAPVSHYQDNARQPDTLHTDSSTTLASDAPSAAAVLSLLGRSAVVREAGGAPTPLAGFTVTPYSDTASAGPPAEGDGAKHHSDTVDVSSHQPSSQPDHIRRGASRDAYSFRSISPAEHSEAMPDDCDVHFPISPLEAAAPPVNSRMRDT